MVTRIARWGMGILVCLMILAAPGWGQQKITTPKEQLGFNIGDDYVLANYTQLVDYWKKLIKSRTG